MKTIIYIFLPIIFLLVACEEDSQQSPNEEEVIEEIFYYLNMFNEGQSCDSVFLYKDSAHFITRVRCDTLPLADTTFQYDLSPSSYTYQNFVTQQSVSYDSLVRFINLDKFSQFEDTTYEKIINLGINWKIRIKTNKRTIEKYFTTVGLRDENLYAEDMFRNFFHFKEYYRRWLDYLRLTKEK